MELDSLLLERRVDALLAPWRDRAGPGVALGVVRKGELVLHRGAGLASIEHGVPIGPGTVTLIAGPCAVETPEQTLDAAWMARSAGASHAPTARPATAATVA